MALDRPFREDFAACGCFETFASGDGIAKLAQAAFKRRKTPRHVARVRKYATTHDVFAAYDSGDSIAKEVLGQAVEFWGMASANLVSLLNPEKIVFGGGVFGPATRFLDAIAEEARKWAQPVAMERVKFEASELGGDAALHGAAYIAWHGRRLPKARRESKGE
jgi:glucokinase